MNRVQLSTLAFVIALPLIAFPIALPPADPGTQLVTRMNTVGPIDEADFPGNILEDDDFSADEWAFFENLLAEHPLERPIDESPEWFQMLTDGNNRNDLIKHEGEYYQLWAYTIDPSPSPFEVVPRLLAFVLGTVLAAVAGHAYVNNTG